MVFFKNAIRAIQVSLENASRVRTLARLRDVDRGFLEQQGISLEALDRGVSAWPWRKPEQPGSVAVSGPSVTGMSRKADALELDSTGGGDRKIAA